MMRARHVGIAVPILIAVGSGCAQPEYPYMQYPYSWAGANPGADVLVTTEDLDRPTVLVAVLDFHAFVDDDRRAVDVLRLRAGDLGADAVIHAEFEHDDDGWSHLSGMAVRYAKTDERPFDVLGRIEIQSPAGSDDKGLDYLVAKAALLGADEVRDIEFEHGEDGNPSRLRGTAVRHRKR